MGASIESFFFFYLYLTREVLSEQVLFFEGALGHRYTRSSGQHPGVIESLFKCKGFLACGSVEEDFWHCAACVWVDDG